MPSLQTCLCFIVLHIFLINFFSCAKQNKPDSFSEAEQNGTAQCIESAGTPACTHTNSLHRTNLFPDIIAGNQVHNAADGLSEFYKKVNNYKKKKSGKIRILFIGDSHIQADFFSGRFRDFCQSSFGSGGRGYAVPVDRPGAPGQMGIHCVISKNWSVINAKKSERSSTLSGFYGLAMRRHISLDRNAFISFTTAKSMTHYADIYYIGHTNGGEIDVYINGIHADTVRLFRKELTASRLRYTNVEGISTLKIISKQNQTLKNTTTQANLDFAPVQIIGAVFESEKSGFVVDAAGLNGARIATAAAMDRTAFCTQLSWREYDLVAVCFGANDALYRKINQNKIKADFHEIHSRISSALPECSVLFITAPDMKPGMNEFPDYNEIVAGNMRMINQITCETAAALGCGFWDQQKAMGGAGSVGIWRLEKLWRSDMIHASYNGYMLLGDMLIYGVFGVKTSSLRMRKQ